MGDDLLAALWILMMGASLGALVFTGALRQIHLIPASLACIILSMQLFHVSYMTPYRYLTEVCTVIGLAFAIIPWINKISSKEEETDARTDSM
jgi:hypothetical protein